MASLQSSCSVLYTTSPHRNTASSKPFSAKPSTFLSNARRSPTFHVSCNGGADRKPSSEGGVDRRNMLLGMGGLYGAANLISDPKGASASPLLPPDFTKCGVAHDGDTILDAKCCPPLSENIVDYKIPLFPRLNVRPAAHQVTKEHIAKYEKAIALMKKLDVDDPTDPRGFMQQANIHCAYCNGAHDQVGDVKDLDIQIHNSWLFFPFHRWYLYFYERIMGKLIGDPTFTLPFWNWDNPKGMQMPKIFDNQKSPLYNTNRDPASSPPTLIEFGFTGETDPAQLIVNNLSQMYSEFFRSVNSTLDFMGKPYRAGDQPPAADGAGTSERGSHVYAHIFVGNPKNPLREDMGNFYSAGRDTLFYCHHANVDRMWTIWRGLKTDVPKDIQDPDYLNASFLFYDENKQLVRVKAGDCINHERMGYEYEKVDTPWLNYKPSKKAEKADIKIISKGAETADKLFPLTLNKVTRVLVPKSAKGKADEVLVLENIVADSTKFVKFDVYINDEDDNPKKLDKAEYAGTFAQVPHKTSRAKEGNGSINLKLTDIYNDIDVDADDTVVVTLIPRSNGQHVTIGGIKIIPAPTKAA